MKRVILLCCVGFLLAAACCASAMEWVDWQEDQWSYGAYIAGLTRKIESSESSLQSRGIVQTLVFLKTDGEEADFAAVSPVQCIRGPGNRYTLVFESRDAAENAIRILGADPHVLYIETDSVIEACDTALAEDIPFHSYGASQMGFQQLLSWARKGAGSSRVAVIDSGVAAHSDFASRLTHGWDYVDNDNDPGNDGSGHGTHVAGIVADCTQGAAVSLYAIRVLDANDRGKASNAANGVLEAIERGIDIINLSFASAVESAFLDDAVQTAVESGCTVVIAAGNGGTDTAGICPAHNSMSGVIVTGAADASGVRASYSNYGTSVDLYAYGTGIVSCSGTGGYTAKSGTSQAAPHVSAVCALLRVIDPGMSPGRLESRLKSCAGQGTVPIPRLDQLTPQTIPLHVASMVLGVGEELQLPTEALPRSSGASFTWSSANSGTAVIDPNGMLRAVSTGNTTILCECSNFDPIPITVTVQDQPSRRLTLPPGLIRLCEEVLLGVPAHYVIAGEALQEIAINAMEKDTVLLCGIDTPAAAFAEANGLTYIAR